MKKTKKTRTTATATDKAARKTIKCMKMRAVRKEANPSSSMRMDRSNTKTIIKRRKTRKINRELVSLPIAMKKMTESTFFKAKSFRRNRLL